MHSSYTSTYAYVYDMYVLYIIIMSSESDHRFVLFVLAGNILCCVQEAMWERSGF